MNEEQLMKMEEKYQAEIKRYEILLSVLVISRIITDDQLLLARRLVIEGAAKS